MVNNGKHHHCGNFKSCDGKSRSGGVSGSPSFCASRLPVEFRGNIRWFWYPKKKVQLAGSFSQLGDPNFLAGIFKYLQVPCLSWQDDQLFDFRNVTTMNPQRTSIFRKEFYHLYYPTIDSYPPARWSCPYCESFPDICGVCPHFTSGTWITINPRFCLVIHDNPNVTWCRLPRTWDVFQTITGRRWPDLWSLCGDCGQGGKGWEGAPLPF